MITNRTITDEQIRALLAELVAIRPRSHGVDECEVALNPMIDDRTRNRARAVCASILNTRIHNARKALEDQADGISEPFCACGRRWSQCDGSRLGCRR